MKKLFIIILAAIAITGCKKEEKIENKTSFNLKEIKTLLLGGNSDTIYFHIECDAKVDFYNFDEREKDNKVFYSYSDTHNIIPAHSQLFLYKIIGDSIFFKNNIEFTGYVFTNGGHKINRNDDVMTLTNKSVSTEYYLYEINK